MMRCIRWALDAFDRFLFDAGDPRMVPVLRIVYALIILIHAAVLWSDAEHWFADTGVLKLETAKQMSGAWSWSLFYLLPSDAFTVKTCLAILVGHAVLMLLGVASRVQAAAVFVWLVSFQNRNPIINDGEDFVIRIMAFMLMWLPLDWRWALWKRGQASAAQEPSHGSCWALRLIQIELTAIYASTALCKLQGVSWWNGTAVWFVSKTSDSFGRLVPGAFFDHVVVSAAATWGTLLLEIALPIALWIRPIRNYAVLAGFALHLGIEISMNLFLFQWIMMLGLLAFVDTRRLERRVVGDSLTHAQEPSATL